VKNNTNLQHIWTTKPLPLPLAVAFAVAVSVARTIAALGSLVADM